MQWEAITCRVLVHFQPEFLIMDKTNQSIVTSLRSSNFASFYRSLFLNYLIFLKLFIFHYLSLFIVFWGSQCIRMSEIVSHDSFFLRSNNAPFIIWCAFAFKKARFYLIFYRKLKILLYFYIGKWKNFSLFWCEPSCLPTIILLLMVNCISYFFLWGPNRDFSRSIFDNWRSKYWNPD